MIKLKRIGLWGIINTVRNFIGGNTLTKIINIYVSLMPVIFTGVLNMVWCKIPVLKKINIPIDNGKKLKDSNRIFGDNKTWKGLIGYIVFGIICTVIWGVVCSNVIYLNQHNLFYANYDNDIYYNLTIGFLLGLFYALFELPNSFAKRRLGIKEGKPPEGMIKLIFIILDQADSIFGCVLVLSFVYPMTILFFFGCVLLGAMTHIVINVLLYLARLRKNPF